MASIQLNSDNTIELRGLRNAVTGQAVTTATVTAVTTYNGVNVSGITWPITLSHVSNGLYRANIPNEVNLVTGREYKALVVADAGADAHWEKCVTLSAIC